MKGKLKITTSVLAAAMMLITAWAAAAQNGATDKRQIAAAKSVVAQGVSGLNVQVVGSGTLGQLPKWTGLNGTTAILGDSVISETKQGNIGIGTTSPASKITVQGMIETTLGGYKFPDGTIQTTAAVSGLSSVFHDATLTGNGTSGSPLGISVPLNLIGPTSSHLVTINNSGGPGLKASSDTSTGVEGRSFHGTGVFGISLAPLGLGVFGSGEKAGVSGGSGSGTGTEGRSFSGVGVFGISSHSDGVLGLANDGIGVHGISSLASASGVFGQNTDGTGVLGSSNVGAGVHGTSNLNFGVLGESATGTAIVGMSPNGFAIAGFANAGLLAGDLQGDVRIIGDLIVAGQKNFKIDHPLDPANKYLVHAALESSEVKNLYDGVIVLNGNGEAVVNLPEWFQALNKDFRYSVTAIGVPGAGLYIAEEVADNHFKIAGGTPGAKVSWQVTGNRNDAYMQKHPMKVELEKSDLERGHYLQPELYNQPEDKSVNWARQPELMQRVKEMREKSKQQ